MQCNVTRLLVIFVITSVLIALVDSTLYPTDAKKKQKTKKKEKKDHLKLKSGPEDYSVFDKNLIQEEPNPDDILIHNAAYFKDTTYRRFTEGKTLGYVTPWNKHGHDVAKIWASKFDIISPVWLQLVRFESASYELDGLHEYDGDWVNAVREGSKNNTKIFPRVVFEKFRDEDFVRLLTNDDERMRIASLMIQTCDDYNFDGIVLEVWSQLALRVKDDYLLRLVKDIAKILKENELDMILVIPSLKPHLRDLFNSNHFTELYSHVTAFSLMTYDYSNIGNPGPSAPIKWMKECVEHICPKSLDNYQEKRKKILLGLNMYGAEYIPYDDGDAIVGHEYLNILRETKSIIPLDDDAQENYFEITSAVAKTRTIYYPTLYSLNKRISLAKELGTGISIWELGQGLDYFYDLF